MELLLARQTLFARCEVTFSVHSFRQSAYTRDRLLSALVCRRRAYRLRRSDSEGARDAYAMRAGSTGERRACESVLDGLQRASNSAIDRGVDRGSRVVVPERPESTDVSTLLEDPLPLVYVWE